MLYIVICVIYIYIYIYIFDTKTPILSSYTDSNFAIIFTNSLSPTCSTFTGPETACVCSNLRR